MTAKDFRIGWQKGGVFALAKADGRPREAPRAARRHRHLDRVHLRSAAARGARRQRASTSARPATSRRSSRRPPAATCVYVAATKGSVDGSAILVKQGLADPDARRPQGQEGRLQARLELRTISPSRRCARAGLTLGDIDALDLGPPDAAPAFANNQIDAWVIWDPYYAIAEQDARHARAGDHRGHRRLAGATTWPTAPIAKANPTIVAEVIDELRQGRRGGAGRPRRHRRARSPRSPACPSRYPADRADPQGRRPRRHPAARRRRSSPTSRRSPTSSSSSGSSPRSSSSPTSSGTRPKL